MHCSQEIKNDDCPVCGKKEGAIWGKSKWGHNYVCCSDECGEKAREILDKNMRSARYKKLEKQLYKIQESISKERHKELLEPEPFYNI